MQWLQLFVGLSAIGFWWCVLYRITHPYKCSCEATFFWYGSYKKHINKRHGVV